MSDALLLPDGTPRAGGDAAPMVYVVLVTWNAWKHTVETLEALLRLRYPRFRVIVCDNGSDDESLDRFREWAEGRLVPEPPADPRLRMVLEHPAERSIGWVEYDRAEAEAGGRSEEDRARMVLVRVGANVGFAVGNNVALRYIRARGDSDYVWVLNNDTLPHPDSLAALVAVAEADPGLGMVGGKLRYYDEPELIQAAGGGRVIRWNGSTALYGQAEPDAGQWDRPLEPEYVHGACMLVRRELLDQVGPFDEAYFIYSEEVDWCVRARRAGWRLGYAPSCVVWHKEGRTIGRRSPTQDYHSVRSRLTLVRKQFPAFLPLTMLHVLYRMVLPKLVRREPDRLRAALRGYRDFLAGRTGR